MAVTKKVATFAVDMCFCGGTLLFFDAQFQLELPPRREIKSKLQSIGVCAIVRRLHHTDCKVVVDLSWSMAEVCAFLFIYNKVSKDFANWNEED